MFNKTKILYLDIETAPNIGWFWGCSFKTSITPEQIIKERFIIMVSYKWKGNKKVHNLSVNLRDMSDKKVLSKLAKVLEKADLVVTHNGDRFDLKWINTRMLYHGLQPIQQYKSEDTLKIAKKYFNFQSNRLNYIANLLGIGNKLDTGGIRLWLDIVLEKCPKALKKMIRYCDQDVRLLERVHNALSHYHKPAINLSGTGLLGCLRCENPRMTTNGITTLASGTQQQRLRCLKCGSSKTIPYNKYLKEIDSGK